MASEEDHAMDDQAHAPDAIEEMVKADMTRVMVRSVQQGLEPFLEKMDQMYQRISKMEARSTPQQRASTADPEEADDEDDDDEPHSHPRRAMTKGEKDFHRTFRDFLAGTKVQLCFSPDTSDLPDPAIVEAYCKDDKNPGPSIPNPQFLWSHPLSHKWNDDLVDAISEAFLDCLRRDTTTERQFLKLPVIKRALLAKLKPIAGAYRKSLPPPAYTGETAEEKQLRIEVEKEALKKKKRRVQRRSNVYQRRSKKLQALLKRDDREYWAVILTIVTLLGKDGVSSDETDFEGDSITPRTLKRVGKPWIHPTVAALVREVDTAPLPKSLRSGPPQMRRLHDVPPAVHDPDSHTMQPVKGLPENLYCSIWYRGLSDLEKKRLKAKPNMVLPTRVESSESTRRT